MMSSVFAVYCDGKSHFIIGTDTADVLSKLDSVILSLDKTMTKGGDGHA